MNVEIFRLVLKTFTVSIFALFLWLPCSANASNRGTDFFVVFMENHNGVDVNQYLDISSESSASGTVTFMDTGEEVEFSVSSGLPTTVTVPRRLMLEGTGNQRKGIRLQSDSPVSVVGVSQKNHSTDAFLALPTSSIGEKYWILSYGNTAVHNESADQFAIVATQDGTSIRVEADTGIGGLPSPITINLDQGEAFQLQVNSAGGANSNPPGDYLSGSWLESNKPVSVFVGNKCANVPLDQSVRSCDHIIEQINSIESYGREFVTTSLATRTRPDTYRVLSSGDGNNIYVNGVFQKSLNRGEFYEFFLSGGSLLTSDSPVLLAQYSNSTTFDGVVADPFMQIIPSVDQYSSSYTTTTLQGFNNYLSIFSRTSQVGNVFVDGKLVDSQLFEKIPGSEFSAVSTPVPYGDHLVTSIGPIGVMAYGFSNADSYGYPAGFGLANSSPVISFADPTGNRNALFDLEHIDHGQDYNTNALRHKFGAVNHVVADGVSLVIVKVKTDSSGVVSFSLPTQDDGRFFELHDWGEFSVGLNRLEVPTVEVRGENYAFAVYRSPAEFRRAKSREVQRDVGIDVSFFPAGSGASFTAQEDISLIRRPLFVSHGLWSNPSTMGVVSSALWDRYASDSKTTLHRSGDSSGLGQADMIHLVDYELLNASGFERASKLVHLDVTDHINRLREKGVVVNQVNWIGHSMGGIHGRLAQRNLNKISDYKWANFNAIHKLITVNTPHHNAYTADLLLQLDQALEGRLVPCGISLMSLPSISPGIEYCEGQSMFREVMEERGMPITDGAIFELATSGLPSVSGNVYAIAGNSFMNSNDDDPIRYPLCFGLRQASRQGGIIGTLGWVADSLIDEESCERPYGVETYLPDGDVIVELDSQKGGLPDSSVTQGEFAHFNMNSEYFSLTTFEGPFDKSHILDDLFDLITDPDSIHYMSNEFKYFNGSLYSTDVNQRRTKSKPLAAGLQTSPRSNADDHNNSELVEIASSEDTLSIGDEVVFEVLVDESLFLSGIQVEKVVFVDKDIIVSDDSYPYTFTRTVPVSDAYKATAYVHIDYQDVILKQSEIYQVNKGVEVKSISPFARKANIGINEEYLAKFKVIYADGSTSVLQNLSDVEYSVIVPEVVNLLSDGVVSGIGIGSTDIIVTHGEHSAVMTIEVLREPPISFSGTDRVVKSGALIELSGDGSTGDIVDYFWEQTGGEPVNLDKSAKEAQFIAPNVHSTQEYEFTLTVEDTQGLVDSSLVSIIVTPVSINSGGNNPPDFDIVPLYSSRANAGPQKAPSFMSNMDDGDANAEQQLQVIVRNITNYDLFKTRPAISYPSGTLRYEAKPGVTGESVVTVQLKDDGGTENGGQDTTEKTFRIVIEPAINQSPTFLRGADQALESSSGDQEVPGWAHDINDGDGGSQTLEFHVTTDRPELFLRQPKISIPSGTLRFTPKPNTLGAANITVTLKDDGGTEDGGTDTSVTQTARISLVADASVVNHTPSFVADSSTLSLKASNKPFSQVWARELADGDGGSQRMKFLVVSNSDPGLFSVQPFIAYPSGELTFTGNSSGGVAELVVILQDDGGISRGGVDTSSQKRLRIEFTGDTSFESGNGVGSTGLFFLGILALFLAWTLWHRRAMSLRREL